MNKTKRSLLAVAIAVASITVPQAQAEEAPSLVEMSSGSTLSQYLIGIPARLLVLPFMLWCNSTHHDDDPSNNCYF